MVLRRALSEALENFGSVNWWRNVVLVPYVIGPLTRLHPNYPGYEEAVEVMAEDWDTLIILDACRADTFEEVVDLSAFDAYSRVVSQGSHSKEWTRRNFEGKQFGDTVYVSMNPHTTLLTDETFHRLIEVWREHDRVPNMVHPTVVVDAAVAAHERNPDKRLIVHFMQPHGTGGLVEPHSSPEATYAESIRCMMPIVMDLIDRLDGKCVVTADHGELFTTGLTRKLGVYKHRARLRLPGLVYVPWAVVDGERRRITEEDVSRNETGAAEVKQRLRDLGYR